VIEVTNLAERRRFIALAAVVAFSAATVIQPVAADSPSTPAAKRLLYVGNSFFYYNNSLHNQVNRLLSAALGKAERDQYSAYSLTISGGHLRWHNVGAYLDAGIGSSAFDENNELVKSSTPYRFDTVMMMDCSRCPYDEATRPIFHEYAKKHSETVRAKGATPVLFMTWAYSDKPEMTEVLAREYIKAGHDNQALVVPAGLAFQRALAGRPDLRLHVRDRRHPSPEGTYLAACTVLASLYGINPVGNRFQADLPAEVAAYLQEVAWATVEQFRSTK
jgi:hypothetical protein